MSDDLHEVAERTGGRFSGLLCLGAAGGDRKMALRVAEWLKDIRRRQMEAERRESETPEGSEP